MVLYLLISKFDGTNVFLYVRWDENNLHSSFRRKIENVIKFECFCLRAKGKMRKVAENMQSSINTEYIVLAKISTKILQLPPTLIFTSTDNVEAKKHFLINFYMYCNEANDKTTEKKTFFVDVF